MSLIALAATASITTPTEPKPVEHESEEELMNRPVFTTRPMVPGPYGYSSQPKDIPSSELSTFEAAKVKRARKAAKRLASRGPT